jgi:hypothetical protein
MHPCWLLGSTSVTTNGHGSQSLSRFEPTEFMSVDTCNCSTVGLKFYIKACYKLYTGVELILSIFAQKDRLCNKLCGQETYLYVSCGNGHLSCQISYLRAW